jgi:drug/metabolite transporter (DMT)-like permease
VVAAFSLSSTLVKRAESPGVLVAFWRMVIVAAVWNVYLLSTGRRVTIANVRQVVVPGVFLGLNLATFFVGATHNSVANAALIGSLAPFVIVPVAWQLFGERAHPAALSAALVAFGGLCLVLFSAPAAGDASIEGNVFGLVAMLLWTGYVLSTRYFRRDMDVATFMATITPIAAVALLPLAMAHGDVFGLSGRGWTYTVILAFLIGVAAHGLNVFAQRTIAVGTIAVAQVVQPPLAVVWSWLLLGEHVNARQVVGIVVVVAGLFAFTLWNQGRHGAGVVRGVEPSSRA